MFGLFAFILIDFSDRKIIELFLGLNELGVYTVAYTVLEWRLFFLQTLSHRLGHPSQIHLLINRVKQKNVSNSI